MRCPFPENPPWRVGYHPREKKFNPLWRRLRPAFKHRLASKGAAIARRREGAAGKNMKQSLLMKRLIVSILPMIGPFTPSSDTGTQIACKLFV
jgi:hypothetical protein